MVDKLALAPNSARVTEPSQVQPNGDVGVLVDIDDNSNLSEAEWSAAMKVRSFGVASKHGLLCAHLD